MKQTIFLLLSLVLSLNCAAEDKKPVSISPSDSAVVARYLDSLNVVLKKYEDMEFDSKLNPYMYKMTTVPTYYMAPLRQALGLDSIADEKQKGMFEALLKAYLNNPTAFQGTESALMEIKNTIATVNSEKETASTVKVEDLVQVEQPQIQAETVALEAEKPNFWTHNANVYFQFSQSYISQNWYNGGESNNSALGGFTFEANYNDQKRIQWDNKAEIKVGFITARGDSLHKYKTNTDLFRLTSKFGYKAVKNWYYTVLGELNNQFFPGYKTNDMRKYSNFLAPLKFNASIGMDWKLKKDKKYEFSLALLPLSYNMIWVAGDEVNPQLFGIKEGEHFLHKFGSKMQLDHSLFFTKDITWKSHFYIFTSYHSTDSLWENTFDFAVNKYLSAKMYLNLRFDDHGVKSDKHGYLQIQELLSFGVSYNL